MPPKKATEYEQIEELLCKLIAINMWTAGAPHSAIKRVVGKGGTWVGDTLEGIPKRKSD